jgi:hypothetical protein
MIASGPTIRNQQLSLSRCDRVSREQQKKGERRIWHDCTVTVKDVGFVVRLNALNHR